jgi:murein DD-endopeptidase MepM/ murein hydrolase activator NlpD
MKAHLGTDYAAPYGTPIMSTGDGVVEKAGYTGGNGNYVKIRHNSTYETQYLHMRKILVKVGQHVKQGQEIGEVGSTGLATGPHVCYRFWKNGRQVDPRKQVMPSAEPLAKADLPAFAEVRDELSARLDAVESKAKHAEVASF